MGLSKDKIKKIECMTWDLLIDVYAEDKIIPPIDLNLIVGKAGLCIRQGVFTNSEIAGAYDKKEKLYTSMKMTRTFEKPLRLDMNLVIFICMMISP